MKKLILSFSIAIFFGAFLVSTNSSAVGCPNSYDVTYPSKYCDPQGEGSCTRLCPGDPGDQ